MPSGIMCRPTSQLAYMPPTRSFEWPTSFRALQHRNFRLYFTGHACSTLGTWVQQVAMAWLVYRLTGSATLLGVTTFAALVPQLLVGPLAGAWIDRHDKRRLLIRIECLLALQALALALLTAANLVGPTVLILMAALLGVLNAIDTPLRQSLISRLVDHRDDLPNALALNAMLFTASRMLGPPIAGLMLAFLSEAVCFAINALSYLALVIGLLCMQLSPALTASGRVGDLLTEGLRYVRTEPVVRLLILSVIAINITASSYVVLLPIYARDVFTGDAQTLGWLWGAAGLGSLASTLLLAGQPAVYSLPRLIQASVFISCLGLAWLGLSTSIWSALLAMMAVGFGITIANVGTNIVVQSVTPEALRGRVVSIYTATRFGFDALGGLLAGILAARFGAPLMAILAGVLLLTYGLATARPLYRMPVDISPLD